MTRGSVVESATVIAAVPAEGARKVAMFLFPVKWQGNRACGDCFSLVLGPRKI